MLVRHEPHLFAAFLVALLAAAPVTAQSVRVMTFNIRFANQGDGDNRWEFRKDLAVKVIRDFDPDVLGLQEALPEQVDHLSTALPAMTSVGVGRNADGTGEYSAIFFRRGRFDLCAAGTFWLSDAPETPGSRTWGNELPRICTWARLLDRQNSQRFTVFNTHWDHQSQPARLASARSMTMRIADLAAAGEPIIVTGDFNAGEDNPAIATLTRDGVLLVDALRRLHPHEKNVGTFHGFSGTPGPAKIDAVFVTESWHVDAADVVRTHDGRLYPADHYPVTAVVTLPPAASRE